MATEKRCTFIKKSVMASAGITSGVPAYIKGYARIQPSDIINVGDKEANTCLSRPG
jgi:hypothetical protein